jgi:uncharacterized secreted repeat protein (TIGR03808 family)
MGYVVNADSILFASTGGTGTLQDAINQAQTTGKPLRIAPGTYSTGDLSITASVEITAVAGGKVMLQPSSASNGFTLNIGSTTGAEITDVTIRGIVFYGASKPFATQVNTTQRYVIGQYLAPGNFNAVISAYKVNRLTISDCSVTYSGSCGIATWGCTATIRNNDLSGNKNAAIYCADGWGSSIVDNFVRVNDNAAIVVCRATQSFDGTIIRGNHIYDTRATYNAAAGQVSGSGWFGNAIYVVHASNAVIDSNVCATNAFTGIRVMAAWNCTITNNQITDSGETALFLEAPGGTPSETNVERFEGGIISNNTIVTCGRGISVTNLWWGGRRATVNGNTVTNVTNKQIVTNDPQWPSYWSGGDGIVAEGDVVVSGNIVENAVSGAGIALYCGQISGSTRKTTAMAVGNTVRKTRLGVAFFKEYAQGYSLIASNLIEGTTGGAVVPVQLNAPVYDTYVRLTGSTDYGTASSGLYTGKPFANVMIGLNFAV